MCDVLFCDLTQSEQNNTSHIYIRFLHRKCSPFWSNYLGSYKQFRSNSLKTPVFISALLMNELTVTIFQVPSDVLIRP